MKSIKKAARNNIIMNCTYIFHYSFLGNTLENSLHLGAELPCNYIEVYLKLQFNFIYLLIVKGNYTRIRG